MASMLEALKRAGLVDEKKAENLEKKRAQSLKSEEQMRLEIAGIYASTDQKIVDSTEKHMKRAAKETRQPSSRVGTPEYYRRFK